MGDILDNLQKARIGKPYGSDLINASSYFLTQGESKGHMKMKIWITTYWTTEIEPVVTPFDNQEAAETCARYYKRQGYKVCVDKCDIFHKCTNTESEDKK